MCLLVGAEDDQVVAVVEADGVTAPQRKLKYGYHHLGQSHATGDDEADCRGDAYLDGQAGWPAAKSIPAAVLAVCPFPLIETELGVECGGPTTAIER